MINSFRSFVVALTLMGSGSFATAGTPEGAGQSAGASLPTATTLFRHVAANGTTKALGASLDQRLGTSMHLKTADMRLSRTIRTSICRGC
jgi:hypothetical protein